MTAFDQVIGHARAKMLFKRALEVGRVAHAYLLEGPPGIGKEALALAVAEALLCTRRPGEGCLECSACRRVGKLIHPDLWYFFPHPSSVGSTKLSELAKEKVKRERVSYSFPATATIPLSDVRMMQKRAGLKPLEGAWKVFIVREADRLTEEASNALLKTLEEAPPRTVVLLTSSASHALLPTVVSRCQRVPMGGLSVEEVATVLRERLGVKDDVALWARLGEGSAARAWEMAEDEQTQAARGLAADLVESCLKGARVEGLLVADKIAATRDRGFVEAVVRVVLGLCRDALAWQSFPDVPIQNIDQGELIARLGASRTFEALSGASERIADVCVALRSNVNLRLAVAAILSLLRGEQTCRSS